MTNKKITIDLNSLIGLYLEEHKILLEQYLEGNSSIETINKIIKQLVFAEFIYYLKEDSVPSAIDNTFYKKITQDQFLYLQEKDVIPEEIKYSEGMYINFEYKNGKYVNDQLGEDYLKLNIPGLFHFNDNIITYYFLDGNEVYLYPDYT